MPSAADRPLLQHVSAAVESGNIPQGLRVKLRLAGGLPHERLDHWLAVDASGTARVRYEDRLRGIGPIVRDGQLSRTDLLALLTRVVRRSDALAFRGEAVFVPGAVTGRLTLELGDQSETYWFGIPDPGDDEEDVQDTVADGFHVTTGMNEALQMFEQYSQRLRTAEGR